MPLDFPASPTNGQTYSSGGRTWVYNLAKGRWEPVARNPVVSSATPPADPVDGTLWYDLDSGVLYIWVTDGTSAQWVEATASSDLTNAYKVGGTDVALGDGGTGSSLVAPSADRMLFYDQSQGRVEWLSAGAGLNFNGTQLDAFFNQENRIINGAFDFWQRGTTQNTFGYKSADRWYLDFSGGTVSFSRMGWGPGPRLGRNNPRQHARIAVSGQSGSNTAYIDQAIEDVRSYAGETITVLGWANRSGGSGNFRVEMYQNFGTGGSPSSTVTVGSVTCDVGTGSWQPFAATFNVPTIAGKTLGTNDNHRLNLRLVASGTGMIENHNLDLWGIHIRVGTHTTAACDAYLAPEFGAELLRCQRYYEKSYQLTTAPGTATTNGIWFGMMLGTPENAIGEAPTKLSPPPSRRPIIFTFIPTTRPRPPKSHVTGLATANFNPGSERCL